MKLLLSILRNYKLNLLVSVTLAIVITALKVYRDPISIAATVLGSLLGAFILELEYFINAFWIDPESEFSSNFKSLINQGNYEGLISYINMHKSGLQRRTLHSILFQVTLLLLLLSLPSSIISIFGFTLILSTFIQTFYQMYEDHVERRGVNDWFWVLKQKPGALYKALYLFAMGLSLVYIFYVI